MIWGRGGRSFEGMGVWRLWASINFCKVDLDGITSAYIWRDNVFQNLIIIALILPFCLFLFFAFTLSTLHARMQVSWRPGSKSAGFFERLLVLCPLTLFMIFLADRKWPSGGNCLSSYCLFFLTSFYSLFRRVSLYIRMCESISTSILLF